MKKKVFVSVLLVMILAVIAVYARIFYINNMMAEVSISEDIYNAAKVGMAAGSRQSVFAGGINLQSVYIYTLYIVFTIFGNFNVAGVYLNLFYQAASVVLVYIIVRNLSEKHLGFLAGIIAAVFPKYITIISEVNALNMEIFLGAVIICVASIFVGRCLHGTPHGTDAKKDEAYVRREEDMLKETGVLTEPEVIPVQDSSMKEIVLADLDDKINYIENPLPVPKRREHKEMDFAFEPSFDDDDYDLTDMTGKDFYDIE